MNRRSQGVLVCMVIAVVCVVYYYYEKTTTKAIPKLSPIPKEVFGLQNVTIASSVHLSSWLSLDARPCHLDETESLKFRYMDVKLICKKTSEPCYVWYWDVANWTLSYSKLNMYPQSAASMFCSLPIHGERTAKIISADSKIEYPGCRKDRHPCAPWPLFSGRFDGNLKQRINRSPCCRKLLVDITHHTTRVFDKHNITYFMVGGPVISLARDGGVLIPYDTDTDIAVDVNDYDKIVQALPELRQHGYVYKMSHKDKKGIERYMVGCTNQNCLNGPGIALYNVEGDTIGVPSIKWQTIPVNMVIPPIRGVFESMETSFPREPEKYLDFTYGKGKWRTPLKCTKHYYDQCSE